MLREQIDLEGIPVHVADTAGIRETSDLIEAEGVRRARQALEAADIVLLIKDASEQETPEEDLIAEFPPGVATIIVGNKIDLLPARKRRKIESESDEKQLWISAKTGQGMDVLRNRIREAVGATDQAEGCFSARQRHTDAR